MGVLWDFAASFQSSLIVTFSYYPVRDVVRADFPNNIGALMMWQHYYHRYSGMFFNPMQPLLLSSPVFAMYTVYGGLLDLMPWNPLVPALCGGATHGVLKNGVRTFATRMGTYRAASESSTVGAFNKFTKQYGAWSWLAGSSYMMTLHAFWYGVILFQLMRNTETTYQFSAAEDFIQGVSTHFTWSMVTAPIRNGFSSTAYTFRDAKCKSFGELLNHEKTVWPQGIRIMSQMVKERGIFYMFSGTPRLILKTSIPFGMTYSMIRSFGISHHPPSRRAGPPPNLGYSGYGNDPSVIVPGAGGMGGGGYGGKLWLGGGSGPAAGGQ